MDAGGEPVSKGIADHGFLWRARLSWVYLCSMFLKAMIPGMGRVTLRRSMVFDGLEFCADGNPRFGVLGWLKP